ncbi:MAG TPA: class I SAM-dependent methyltransferase, partial [Vicinamibacterales bacterium]|nr:class I SAM-dependent methyltransferase [Vicinamibacterales bacterium]
RLLSRSEVAHSTEMKAALRDVAMEGQYRAHELARVKAAVARFAVPVADRIVLDVGCNDGALTAGLPQLGARQVIGVDVDAAAIERATARGLPIRFLVSGVDGIPLPDASVDTAISYDVFEHVSRPEAIAKELARVVRPDGTVLIGTWSWCHPFAPHLWSVMPVPWAHMVVSERTLLAACRRVYHSPWYVPDRHDFDASGQRKRDKYNQTALDRDYLNQYRIRDFERAFESAGWSVETYPMPFGSLRWTAPLLKIGALRDWLSGYVWFILRRNVQGA